MAFNENTSVKIHAQGGILETYLIYVSSLTFRPKRQISPWPKALYQIRYVL